MDKITAIPIFESLASGTRLDMYRLLVRAAPDGMVAGDIATALQIAPNSASFHLKTMTQAGLLTVAQQGRFQRYRANLGLMTDLIDYLTAECCMGNPEQCSDLSIATPECCEKTP